MVGAVPQSIHNDLVARINELASQRSKSPSADDWTWRALKRDVEKLAKNPQFTARATLLLATVWGLVGNTEEMERCFNQYAGKYGKDWPWYRGRAFQGPALGRLDVVVDMLNFGYPKGDKATADFVGRLCYQSGLFLSAEKALLHSAEISGGSLAGADAKYYGSLPSIITYINEHELDEKDIADRLQVASRVVVDMTGPLTTFSVSAGDWGITLEYTVDDEIERLVEIDFAITRRLVIEFEDPLSQHISIGVRPLSESETNAN
ncbi:hypothetical protein ACIPI6_00310 [Pseudomonas protegens]|uniref:hypothetical protein n=1 Tax=Pseudomonas protegens TaxID=380021 RepID=UPI0038119045